MHLLVTLQVHKNCTIASFQPPPLPSGLCHQVCKMDDLHGEKNGFNIFSYLFIFPVQLYISFIRLYWSHVLKTVTAFPVAFSSTVIAMATEYFTNMEKLIWQVPAEVRFLTKVLYLKMAKSKIKWTGKLC